MGTILGTMASKYRRTGSPYWYVKHRDETGAICREATHYRVGIGSKHAHASVRLLNCPCRRKTAGWSTEAGNAFDQWVPGFLESNYSNSPKTLVKYQSCWRALRIWMRTVGIVAPIHLQRHHAAEYVTWRTSEKGP